MTALITDIDGNIIMSLWTWFSYRPHEKQQEANDVTVAVKADGVASVAGGANAAGVASTIQAPSMRRHPLRIGATPQIFLRRQHEPGAATLR